MINSKYRWLALFTMSFIGLVYLYLIEEYISLDVNDNGGIFAALVLPDTFIYKNLLDTDNILFSLLNSGVKNSIGPSMLWLLTNKSWLQMFFLSSLMVFVIQNCIFKISKIYKISNNNANLIILCTTLSPSMIFYSIGASKEIPSMLLLLLCFTAVLEKRYLKLIVYFFILALFRYQLAVFGIILYIIYQINKRDIFRFSFKILAAMCMLFPAFDSFDIIMSGTSELFRNQVDAGTGMGAFIESMRDVYFISFFAIILRAFQSVLEPIVSYILQFSLYNSDGYIGIYSITQLLSFFIFFPFFFLFIRKLFLAWKIGDDIKLNIGILYGFTLLTIVLIGGTSFIHHRYLFPIFPLVMIASMIPASEMRRSS